MRFAIRIAGTGEFLGSINLTPDKDNPHRGEMGYYMGSEYQGKGFATEAVNMLCDVAFGQLQYQEVYAKIHQDNRASQQVVKKAGFIEAGLKKGDFIFAKAK